MRIPFIKEGVSAGFPSPAADFMESNIDLNKVLSENPLATFYIKVKGNSMIDAGINDKDVLVVDRSLEPKNNKIAICFIDGEFTVKRIQLEKDCLYLMPENSNYSPIKVTEENQLIIWGIVTYVIKKV
jgi:DNA polymerase V